MIRVKICGITNAEDAHLAVEAGADALGFIFVEGTPRYIDPAAAAAIIRWLPRFLTPVGVFWDHAAGHVKAVAEACGLRALQFHGDEKPEDLTGYGLPIIKTIKLPAVSTIEGLPEYRVRESFEVLRYGTVTSAVLLDTAAQWSEGEAREPIEWPEAARIVDTYRHKPRPLYFAERLTHHCGGARIYLKREDLCHTGAHKINNVLGQALLAVRMGKKRIIAETGTGQHGVASATAAALMGLECEVYMGEVDVERQALNVFRMNLLGARVHPVQSGSRTLKDAVNEALRDWVTNVRSTYYVTQSRS